MCHAACTLFIGPDVQAKAFAHAVAGTLLACIQAVLKNAQGRHNLPIAYVWGKPQALRNVTPGTKFSPVIEHSITVTVALGYRYLWFDRLVHYDLALPSIS